MLFLLSIIYSCSRPKTSTSGKRYPQDLIEAFLGLTLSTHKVLHLLYSVLTATDIPWFTPKTPLERAQAKTIVEHLPQCVVVREQTAKRRSRA